MRSAVGIPLLSAQAVAKGQGGEDVNQTENFTRKLGRMQDKVLKLLPLPAFHDEVRGLYWRPNDEFIDELVTALTGKKVLEIFAGNGYLAGILASRGIDIVATSILSGIDAHEYGVYHPVDDVNALNAVQKYGEGSDVLLMCWPMTTMQVTYAAEQWGDRPIVFIGEYTDYSKDHLGGCATDEFFEGFTINSIFSTYQGSYIEKACMGNFSPAHRDIDRQRT